MAFLPSQLTLLFIIAAAASLAVGLPPYFEGYYQPAFYYPNLRYSRSAPAASAASISGAGASSYAGSGATSSSGTHVAAGPGGSGAFNAFAGTGPANDYGPPNFGGFGGQPGYGYGGGGGGYGYGGFPGFSFPSFDFNRFFQDFQESQRKAQEAAASGNGVYKEGPGYVVWASHYPGETGSFFSSYGGSGSSNEVGVGATASGEYSPYGGYGAASVYPGAPQGFDMNFGGLDDRFGGGDGGGGGAGKGPVNSVSGGFKPPGGNHFGVFTSSASHSTNVDGKVTSHKMATVGVNDNGKVTTYTAHDP